MNLHTKQKQTHKHRKQAYGHHRVVEGQVRIMGLTDTNHFT